MTGVQYRKMTVADVGGVLAVEIACFTTPWTEESFHYEMTANEYAMYIVAELNDRIVGFSGMWMVFGDVQITNVAVLAEARGLGIGEGLMRTAMATAKAHKMEIMSLEVRISNAVAQNLYRKLGFQDGGIRKAYYTDNQEDALVMWVNL